MEYMADTRTYKSTHSSLIHKANHVRTLHSIWSTPYPLFVDNPSYHEFLPSSEIQLTSWPSKNIPGDDGPCLGGGSFTEWKPLLTLIRPSLDLADLLEGLRGSMPQLFGVSNWNSSRSSLEETSSVCFTKTSTFPSSASPKNAAGLEFKATRLILYHISHYEAHFDVFFFRFKVTVVLKWNTKKHC